MIAAVVDADRAAAAAVLPAVLVLLAVLDVLEIGAVVAVDAVVDPAVLVVDPACADVELSVLAVFPTPACAAAMIACVSVICFCKTAACCRFPAAWFSMFCLACARSGLFGFC